MNQQKLLHIPILFFLLFFSATLLTAQDDRDRREERREHPERQAKKELTGFASRLWYGGGVSIGFSGFNGASVFSLGLSPMVGYKIYGPFSAGPRVSLYYTSYKQRGFKALNVFDTEAGIFLRAKVFKGFFLQGEVAQQWGNDIYQDFSTGELFKQKNEFSNQYLGAGYNFGDGNVGSEIGIYYNVAAASDVNSSQSIWQPRFGFTWKF